jgi:DNA-binding transcriptional LysR family regulator
MSEPNLCDNDQMFDWDDVRVLDTLASTGSLAAAARALKVNHATISRRIASLEAALGVALVVRLPRSTPLTPQGQAIAALARDMETTAQAIGRRARSFSAQLTGEVTISLPPALASDFVAERLADFRAAYPDLSVTLRATPAISSLERGEADIAVRLVPPTGPDQVVRRLGAMRMELFASTRVASRPPEDWSFIFSDTNLADLPHQVWLSDYAGSRAVAVLSSDIHTQIRAAQVGLGVAVLPLFMAQNDPSLVRVDPDARPPVRPIWLVMHTGVRHAPAIRATANWLAEIFGASEAFRPPSDFIWPTVTRP